MVSLKDGKFQFGLFKGVDRELLFLHDSLKKTDFSIPLMHVSRICLYQEDYNDKK